MDYDLALKLKNAGFPQWENLGRIVPQENGQERVSYPTLSELITACDDDIDLVVRSARSWASKIVGTRIVKVHGSTPEEAVASLWLELQK